MTQEDTDESDSLIYWYCKIELVVYYQYNAAFWLVELVAKSTGFENQNNGR